MFEIIMFSILLGFANASENLTPSLKGKDYRGYQDKTNGGWPCQRWDQ